MTTPITLEFKERNAVLSGLVSDEVAIFFMSWLFDEKERSLYANGQRTEAANLLVKRREEALKFQSEDEYGEIVLNRFFHEYSHNTETRISIVTRLTEIFDFPAEMISRRNDGSYKICLEMREIAEIVFGIVGAIPAIKEEMEKKQVNSSNKEKLEIKEVWKEKAQEIYNEVVDVRTEETAKIAITKIADLQKEIEALKKEIDKPILRE